MTFSVNITKQAENDLHSVYEYIAYDLQSSINAAGQLSRLEKAILGLDSMPSRYKLYEKEPWKSRGLHVMPVDNYLVFYIVDRQLHEVNILRVMYGGRNVEMQLEEKE